jgi:hypothetical protein
MPLLLQDIRVNIILIILLQHCFEESCTTISIAGTLPAPPLHGGMGDASLVPQGALPAHLLHRGVGDASLAPQGTLMTKHCICSAHPEK